LREAKEVKMEARTGEENSLTRYIAAVRAIWGDGKAAGLPLRVKALLEELLRTTPPDEPWLARLIGEGRQSQELYRDPDFGFIQMGHNQPAGHRNAPHDHGPCWVLYGVYRGRIDIATYRRTDDGKIPGRAALEVKEVHRLTPGVVYPYLSGEIHSTSAPEASVVFRFLSYDLNRVERYRYDLEAGTVSLVR
jgi:hypothetical protein